MNSTLTLLWFYYIQQRTNFRLTVLFRTIICIFCLMDRGTKCAVTVTRLNNLQSWYSPFFLVTRSCPVQFTKWSSQWSLQYFGNSRSTEDASVICSAEISMKEISPLGQLRSIRSKPTEVACNLTKSAVAKSQSSQFHHLFSVPNGKGTQET